MRTKKQKFFLFLKIFAIMLLLTLGSIYYFRDALLHKVISRAMTKLDQEYNCTFSVKKAAFIQLSGIELEGIVIKPKDADTLLAVEKIKTNINLLQLLTGDIQLQSLELKKGFIQLIKDENGRNFDAFLKKEKKKEKERGRRSFFVSLRAA